LALAAIQIALLGAVAADFAWERSHYPHLWLQAVAFDPALPIRGRYVRLAAVVQLDEAAPVAARRPGEVAERRQVRLEVRSGARGPELRARPDDHGGQWIRPARCGDRACWVLGEALAYFLPESAADPSRLVAGETLWIDASIPPHGPPRPIRLGTMRGDSFALVDAD